MTDPLDDLIRHAAPPTRQSFPATRGDAERLARVIIEEAHQGGRRPPRRRRHLWLVGTLSLAGLGLGVAGAVAGPVILDWAGFVPDAAVQRSFDLGDGQGNVLCQVAIQVEPDYSAGPAADVEREAREARVFLSSHDWDPTIASVDAEARRVAIEQEQADADAGGFTADPGIAVTRLIADRIIEQFRDAGYGTGVSIESAGGCDIGEEQAP
ncbi:hypothetical protein [Rathayibacter sp. VKM Ac-2857]|uniref:hypothetical protein n=1 Tax=Rathayibacter sp. VKM Ac-2857 TaxID=2739020 RepID=UPI00156417E4|nr:hypothetical protein [Rathayibacter sp. VKM Ac-2857]NQX17972.1 hypothetical protein [Rathayibacter sp. VKM Ac-2857]